MKRRTVLKSFFIVAGGMVIFPSCSGDPAKASIDLKNIDITADQEQLLAEIAEAIIPHTADAPGSKELNLHLFTLKMVDDCYSPDEQQEFVAGLSAFKQYNQKTFNGGFAKLPSDQKTSGIISFLAEANSGVKKFFDITKREVIRGFTQSKFVMTDKKQYEMVPGRYNGYFPVSNPS